LVLGPLQVHLRTSSTVKLMSAGPSKADVRRAGHHVCEVPETDIQADPLMMYTRGARVS
jgi:hypothetical protein